MAINIPATLIKIDKTLIAQKLYTPATFSEVKQSSSTNYDPITGTYAGTSDKTDHSFNIVVLDESRNSSSDGGYNVTTQIMILPQNISFEPNTGQDFAFKGKCWSVVSVKLSPQDSLWEITVGRL
tara:strand:+ start:821 stop:1195 length:375 start_codon:yes stop_codon:yes gene_type:complete